MHFVMHIACAGYFCQFLYMYMMENKDLEGKIEYSRRYTYIFEQSLLSTLPDDELIISALSLIDGLKTCLFGELRLVVEYENTAYFICEVLNAQKLFQRAKEKGFPVEKFHSHLVETPYTIKTDLEKIIQKYFDEFNSRKTINVESFNECAETVMAYINENRLFVETFELISKYYFMNNGLYKKLVDQKNVVTLTHLFIYPSFLANLLDLSNENEVVTFSDILADIFKDINIDTFNVLKATFLDKFAQKEWPVGSGVDFFVDKSRWAFDYYNTERFKDS